MREYVAVNKIIQELAIGMHQGPGEGTRDPGPGPCLHHLYDSYYLGRLYTLHIDYHFALFLSSIIRF